MTTGLGRDIGGCPDVQATSTTGRHTLLMVTQTGRGEVAVIDMTTRTVIDEDYAAPGTEFLPIGAMPVSIASTPGGTSTFVATAEPGREAIFVLPTSCVMPPKANEPPRDLTQWSACKLPGAPGEMLIIPDGNIISSDGFRQACDAAEAPVAAVASRDDCPADWDAEERVSPAGRRKLLVTLPKLGGLALLDARTIHEMQPGAFDLCPIERWLQLSPQAPDGVSQSLPADLKADESQGQQCSIVPPRYSFGPSQSPFVSQPAGISFNDGTLYVADLGTPAIHVVDLKDPCALREVEPLAPSSLEEPSRPVFTSDVAVSELTHAGKRFVYAVDDARGNLLAFDVSPGSQQRSPMVFSGSPYLPFDPPDRIKTNLSNARVRDLMFVKHDVPIVDQSSSSATPGVACDPSPEPVDSSAAEYRTSSDYTRGASPSKLRGTFAVVALSDGRVGAVDVEDLDAPCRRPIEGNRSAALDWRGCKNDAEERYETSTNKLRTVSDEASCNVVVPHKARSARFLSTNSTVGTGAPSLPTFPALTSPSGSGTVGSSSRGNSTPKMLAVPFPSTSGHSQVYIGSTLYEASTTPNDPSATRGATSLEISPASASNNSVLLPFVEPRAYLPNESFSVTYEGKLFDDRQSGIVDPTSLSLYDPDAHFCDQGVQDIDAVTDMARDFVSTTDETLAASQLAAFVPAHPDFVQITSDFSDNDPYWITPVGASCAKDTVTGVSGVNGCRSFFGTLDNFKTTREWRVTEAYQDRLVVEPLDTGANTLANLHCCFPGTVKYTVRAAGQWVFRGQQPMTKLTVNVDSKGRCVRDCDLRKTHLRNRAVEIGHSADPSAVCVVNDDKPIEPSTNPAGCVFDSLKARFAVYSGTSASIRDMAFTWQVAGGFLPFQLNLSNRLTGTSILPQSMTPAPNLNAFFVVDGVSGGVFALMLDPFGVNGDPYL